MLWVAFAFGSAFFAGITAILAKIGIRDVDSTLATALRTVVILLFSWLMVFVVGSQGELRSISSETIAFLVLSGLSTGASWLCYFKALQLGNVNKVTPIDKSSTVLTIVLSFLLLGESLSMARVLGNGCDHRRHTVDDHPSGRDAEGTEGLAAVCAVVCCVCQSDRHFRQAGDRICGV